MIGPLDELLGLLRLRWPEEWNDSSVQDAIGQLIDDADRQRPTSLPVVQKKQRIVAWLTIAGSARELQEYLDDAGVWLQRVDAQSINRVITPPSAFVGPFAEILRVIAPCGYVRWDTPLERGRETLLRLGSMQRYLGTCPDLSRGRVPSLAALRLEFISAIRVGNWQSAEACIDEIDHWYLDNASSTIQMRVRLLEARGATTELFQFICRVEAWRFSSPRRIAAAIVWAVDASVITPVEAQDGVCAAYSLFRDTWYPKLVQTIADASREPETARLRAFAAAVDGDGASLNALLGSLTDAVGKFLWAQLPLEANRFVGNDHAASVNDPASMEGSARDSLPDEQCAGTVSSHGETEQPPDAQSYWSELHAAVTRGQVVHARALLSALNADFFDDPCFLGAAPDALLGLLSDPKIDSQSNSRILAYEVLTELVDAFVIARGFPRLVHLEIYLALLEGLIELTGDSASEADSQLVLGLVSATALLSRDAVQKCENVVRSWWKRRPITQRLGWLAAALDSLAPIHDSPSQMVDLYTEGLSLAVRKGLKFSKTETKAWKTIGRALELDAEDVKQLVEPASALPSNKNQDVLANAGLRQIAIVSLLEPSARDAAIELQLRTGAKVSVVTALDANAETRHASMADLILYVWAASTHATYRAFDNSRDKIEYVQGTGSASIVMAAERWADRSQILK